MSAEEFSLREFASRLDEQSKDKKEGKLTSFLRKQLLQQLNQLELGSLEVTEKGVTHSIITNQPEWVQAEIEVKHHQFYRYLAFGGSVGAAEAYMLGYWDSPNLKEVIRLFAINQSTMFD